MRFVEAKEKLKVLAAGRYHAIGFELTEFAGGRQETECYLYIDSQIAARSPTWEGALLKLKKELWQKGWLVEMPTEESPEV